MKKHFGDLPIKALEDAAVINGFKTESAYAKKVEIATMHKVLAILRAAIRWARRKHRRSSRSRRSTASAFD